MFRLSHDRGALVPVVLTFAVLLVLAGVGPRSEATGPGSGPTLDAGSVRRALSSEPLPGGVAADAVAFHAGRRAERPGDPLSTRALVSLHLLRHRAYGAEEELVRAETLLEGLAATYADDATLHAQRASVALTAHDFSEAVRASRAAVAASPPGVEGARLRLFDALVATGAYPEARSLLEGLDPHPVTQGFLSRKARLLDALGDVEGAAEVMEEVVRLTEAYADPPVVRAWARVEAGHFLHHSGRTEAGVARYLEALELVPGYPAALEALGWIAYGVDRDPATAEVLFRTAVEHGGHLDLYATLAEVAAAAGASERARSYRETFLREARTDEGVTESDPAAGWDRRAWRPLALILADDPSTLGEARRLAQADLEQRRDRDALATLAWVLHRSGRGGEALPLAEEALAWGAPTPATLHRAGVVILEAGDRRRGRRLLREALDGEAELGPVVAAGIRGLLESDAAR